MNRKIIIAIICAVALMITMAITVFASNAFAPDAEASEPVTTISEVNIPS